MQPVLGKYDQVQRTELDMVKLTRRIAGAIVVPARLAASLPTTVTLSEDMVTRYSCRIRRGVYAGTFRDYSTVR